ncbi:MAG: hypothetical protein ACREJO_06725 [Phycisphaerales bacterium]
METGLTPSALAAIGLTDVEAATLIRDLAASPAGLAAIQTRVALNSAETLAVAPQGTQVPDGVVAPASVQARQSAIATSRTAARVAARALADDALTRLDPIIAQRLRNWRSSSSQLPPEMRVVAWSPAQSKAILRALRQERVALARGEQVSAQAAAVLAEARSHVEVVAAQQRLSQRLAAVTTAIRTATAP